MAFDINKYKFYNILNKNKAYMNLISSLYKVSSNVISVLKEGVRAHPIVSALVTVAVIGAWAVNYFNRKAEQSNGLKNILQNHQIQPESLNTLKADFSRDNDVLDKMNKPIMRFSTEKVSGIALNLIGTQDSVRGVRSVLFIHEHDVDRGPMTYSWSNEDLENAIIQNHTGKQTGNLNHLECEGCPFLLNKTINPKFLSQVLNGKHPVCRLNDSSSSLTPVMLTASETSTVNIHPNASVFPDEVVKLLNEHEKSVPSMTKNISHHFSLKELNKGMEGQDVGHFITSSGRHMLVLRVMGNPENNTKLTKYGYIDAFSDTAISDVRGFLAIYQDDQGRWGAVPSGSVGAKNRSQEERRTVPLTGIILEVLKLSPYVMTFEDVATLLSGQYFQIANSQAI